MPAPVTLARRQQAMMNLRPLRRGAGRGKWTERFAARHAYREGLDRAASGAPRSGQPPNAYVRLKLALTEEKQRLSRTTRRPGQIWRLQIDPIDVSLTLLSTVHDRWDRLWRSMKPEQFARVLVHPEHGERSVDWLLFLYEWHGRHHTAHITELASRRAGSPRDRKK